MIKTIGSVADDFVLVGNSKVTMNPKVDAEDIYELFVSHLTAATYDELSKLFIRDNVAIAEVAPKWFDPKDVTEFSDILLTFDGILSSDEIDTISDLLGWALKVNICSPEGLSKAEIMSNTRGKCELLFYYDTTKSPRDDIYFVEAFDKFKEIMKDGSDIRKTNRAGIGTKGTRLVQGLGVQLPVEIKVK